MAFTRSGGTVRGVDPCPLLVIAADLAAVGLLPDDALSAAATVVGASPAELDEARAVEARTRSVLDAFRSGAWERAGFVCPTCAEVDCPRWQPVPAWWAPWAIIIAAHVVEAVVASYPDPF